MSDLERQLRAFVREGDIPVPDVPDLAARIAGAQRRHRQRRVAGVVGAAGVVAVAAVAGVVLRGDDTTPQPAGSGPSCTGVTLRSAGVSTDAAAGPTLALALGGGTGGHGRCPIGPGTRIDVGTGVDALTTTLPPGTPWVRLRPGEDAVLELTWATWCGDGPPQVRVTFSTGDTTTLDLPADTALPACGDPSAPASLGFVALHTVDVHPGGTPGTG